MKKQNNTIDVFSDYMDIFAFSCSVLGIPDAIMEDSTCAWYSNEKQQASDCSNSGYYLWINPDGSIKFDLDYISRDEENRLYTLIGYCHIHDHTFVDLTGV